MKRLAGETAIYGVSSIVGKLYRNDKIEVNEKIGNWYRCEYNGQETYVSADYVAIMKVADANVYTDEVPVRKQPNQEAEIIGAYYNGSTPVITEIGDEWCEVLYYGDLGYVQRSYLDICNEVQPEQNNTGSAVVEYAKQFIGTPYVSGGKGPGGFDCSGFTSYVYAAFGVQLNSSSKTQINQGVAISQSELQPGDLVFFVGTYDTAGISHVGFYVGLDEASNPMFLHCGDPIQYTRLNTSYWQQHFYAYGRPPYD